MSRYQVLNPIDGYIREVSALLPYPEALKTPVLEELKKDVQDAMGTEKRPPSVRCAVTMFDGWSSCLSPEVKGGLCVERGMRCFLPVLAEKTGRVPGPAPFLGYHDVTGNRTLHVG